MSAVQYAIRLVNVELPIKILLGATGNEWRLSVVTLYRRGRFGFEPKLPHQPANFVDTDLIALVVQFFHNPSGTVFTAMGFKYSGCIKTAPADPHHRTQHGDRIGLHLLPDEL
jgi:hypothetical protein